MTTNPVQSAHEAPRCTATAKSTQSRCKAPAVRGWRVCRMHGARGGAPTGPVNGRYRHGARTKETAELIRQANQLVRSSLASLQSGANDAAD